MRWRERAAPTLVGDGAAGDGGLAVCSKRARADGERCLPAGGATSPGSISEASTRAPPIAVEALWPPVRAAPSPRFGLGAPAGSPRNRLG